MKCTLPKVTQNVNRRDGILDMPPYSPGHCGYLPDRCFPGYFLPEALAERIIRFLTKIDAKRFNEIDETFYPETERCAILEALTHDR